MSLPIHPLHGATYVLSLNPWVSALIYLPFDSVSILNKSRERQHHWSQTESRRFLTIVPFFSLAISIVFVKVMACDPCFYPTMCELFISLLLCNSDSLCIAGAYRLTKRISVGSLSTLSYLSWLPDTALRIDPAPIASHILPYRWFSCSSLYNPLCDEILSFVILLFK